MYFMYVDESGDCGIVNSPTQYYILSGVVVHELRWKTYLDQMIDFRKRMKNSFGLFMREEIHSAHFICNPGPLSRIKRNDRLTILRLFANEIATMTDLSIINVVIDKMNKRSSDEVFSSAWKTLIQRFENTITYNNFPGPRNSDERGCIVPDQTDEKRLVQLLRRMRRYNPIPSNLLYSGGYRNIHIKLIVEDPFFKKSEESYFIQIADLASFLLYQNKCPNAYMRKKSASNYWYRLEPVLCKVASKTDPYGVVHL